MDNLYEFKYEISNDLRNLLMQTIVDFNQDYLIGYMPIQSVKKLKHCSLWLVCSYIKEEGKKDQYTNPMVIVAKSNPEALMIYTDITGDIYDTVLEEIQRDCRNIKVLPA